MLHNSLYRRELLLSTNRNPEVLRRRDVHRTVSRRTEAKAGPGQLALTGPWSVTTARSHPAENLVAADAADFLKRMGVELAESSTNAILIELSSHPAGFRTVIDDHRIELHAADASALWSGWVHLELLMRAAGTAVLPKGELSKRPAWDTQIAPPAWGANYAVPDLSPEFDSDDVFRSLAHAGATAMFVYGDFLLYAKDSPIKELDHPDSPKYLATLKDTATRAGNYGVKLYFVLVSPKLTENHPAFAAHPEIKGALLHHEGAAPPIHCLCSSNPLSLDWHAATVGGLFREVPDLGGVVAIIGGESYYHCFMRSAGSPIGDTNCPQCKGKLAEEVIANLLKVTADAIHQHAPAAKVLAWPYSAQYFWSKERSQLALIDRLPEGVALLSEVDKEQLIHKEAGYDKLCWDYSVEFDGATDRIIAQSRRCAERSRELFVKTETAHGIELLHLPYVPSLTRSARQWLSVKSVRPAGVLQRWGFIGMFDSAAERLAYLARWDENFSPDVCCDFLARTLVGPPYAAQLVQAWRQFDRAVGHLPTLIMGGYYLGPLFLGPAHPLPVWTGPTPDAFLGNLFYLAEAEATGDSSRRAAKDDFTVHTLAQLGGAPPLAIQEQEYLAARNFSAAGHKVLASLDPSKLDPGSRDELAEQLALGEYLHRTLISCHNLVRFLRLRDEAKAPKDQLAPIAQDELANTTAARALYDRAPWLNHSLRLDVGAPESTRACDEKARLLKDYLKT
jgi:hypothetical protein